MTSETHAPLSLEDCRVGVTAERRSEQQVRYIEARGGQVVQAPVMRTCTSDETGTLLPATAQLLATPPDVMILQTGQGLKWWMEALGEATRTSVVDCLQSAAVWSRGAKATSACRSLGLEPEWQAPSETVADIVARLQSTDLQGRSVGVQTDGSDPEGDSTTRQCLDAIAAAEAHAVMIEVYRYAIPNDLGPVIDLVDQVLAQTVDAVTFTSSPAIQNLRRIAAQSGLGGELDEAFRSSCHAVVVGPVCADTARRAGWRRIVEPETARLIPMLDAMSGALSGSPTAS